MELFCVDFYMATSVLYLVNFVVSVSVNVWARRRLSAMYAITVNCEVDVDSQVSYV